jgi:hypothetical protein
LALCQLVACVFSCDRFAANGLTSNHFMPSKRSNKHRPFPVPRAKDLFRQVPVLESEIHQWVCHFAPHIAHAKWRIAAYAKGYNVADKIRAAKIDGSFFQIDFGE